MKRFFIITILVAAGAAWLAMHSDPPVAAADKNVELTGAPVVPKPAASGSQTSQDELTALLTKVLNADRPALAVTRVVGLAAPDLLNNDRLIDRAKALVPDSSTNALLTRDPQCFGILLVLDPVARPRFVESLLGLSSEDQERFISSCMKYADAPGLRAWTAAFSLHPTLIVGLLQQSPTWPIDQAFTFDRVPAGESDESAKIYDAWLEDAFAPGGRLRAPDDSASMLQFVLRSGPEIRRKLRTDDAFRVRFPHETWSKISRSIERFAAAQKKGPLWHCCATSPSLWKLMEEPDGEELYSKEGAWAADLLCSEDPGVALPICFRPQAITAIRNGNERLLIALTRYGTNPDFQNLAMRVDAGLLAKACADLDNEGVTYPDKLREWRAIRSASSLEAELGPKPSPLLMSLPGAAIVYSVTKIVEGRKVTPAEIMAALSEVTDIAHDYSEATNFPDMAQRLGSRYGKNLEDRLPELLPGGLGGSENASPGSSSGPEDPIAQNRRLRAAHDQVEEALKSGPYAWSAATAEGRKQGDTLPVDPDLSRRLERAGARLVLLTESRTILQLRPAPANVADSPFRRAAKRMEEQCQSNPAILDLWQAHTGTWFLHLATDMTAPSLPTAAVP